MTARNAPVMDDFIPDGNFDMRRGWEAAIKACLDQLCAATPSPGAGRALDAACDAARRIGRSYKPSGLYDNLMEEATAAVLAALGAGSTRGEPDQELRAAREALKTHVHHTFTCDCVTGAGRKCNCGYPAAMTALRAALADQP